MLLVQGPHFEKHGAHIHSQTGWLSTESSVNHILHPSAEEAISCERVRTGFTEEQTFVCEL